MAFRSLTKLLRSRIAPSIPSPLSSFQPLPMRTIRSSTSLPSPSPSPSLHSSIHHYSSCRSSFSSSSASPSPRTCSKRAHTTATTATRQPSQTTVGDTATATASQQHRKIVPKSTTTPDAPQFLGLAGVIPFATGALATAIAPETYIPMFATATQLYGASILSFLGGVHWGLALRHNPAVMTKDFVVSVIPSLVGWSAALANPNPGLAILSSSFVMLYGYDRFRLAASRVSPMIPSWYLPMRLPLTVAAAGGCAVSWYTVYRCENDAKEKEKLQSETTEDEGNEA